MQPNEMLTLFRAQHHLILQRHKRLHGSISLGFSTKGRGPLCTPTVRRLLCGHVNLRCRFRASEKLQSDFSSFSVPHLDTRPDEISSEKRAQSNPCSLSCREHLNRPFPNAQCPPSPKDHNDTEQHKYTYTHAHDGFLFSICFLALAPCNTSEGRKELGYSGLTNEWF